MASTCRIVEAVRGGEGESLSCVYDHAGVNAMTVPTVLSKEGGRVVLRLRHQETIVASETPARVACVPFHAAANVADEEGRIASHAQAGAFEHRQAADSAGAVHARGPQTGCCDNPVDVVVQHVGS